MLFLNLPFWDTVLNSKYYFYHSKWQIIFLGFKPYLFFLYLSQCFFRPVKTDLAHQPLYNDSANFGSCYFPNGKRIIFSSNLHDPNGRDFDLYAINTNGTGLERITYFDGFDGFPMFSADGRCLVFASNRNQAEHGETNLFIIEWKK